MYDNATLSLSCVVSDFHRGYHRYGAAEVGAFRPLLLPSIDNPALYPPTVSPGSMVRGGGESVRMVLSKSVVAQLLEKHVSVRASRCL